MLTLLILRFQIFGLNRLGYIIFLYMLTLLLSSWCIDYLFHLYLLTGSLSFLNYLFYFRISFFFLNNWSFCKNWLKYLILFNDFRLSLLWRLIKNMIHYFWFLLWFWLLFLLILKRILNSDMFQCGLCLLLNICKLPKLIFFLIFILLINSLLQALLLYIFIWIIFLKVTLYLHTIRNYYLNFINSLLRINLDFTWRQLLSLVFWFLLFMGFKGILRC